MRAIITWVRRLLCRHAFDFVERLPELDGRAAGLYRCAHCGRSLKLRAF